MQNRSNRKMALHQSGLRLMIQEKIFIQAKGDLSYGLVLFVWLVCFWACARCYDWLFYSGTLISCTRKRGIMKREYANLKKRMLTGFSRFSAKLPKYIGPS